MSAVSVGGQEANAPILSRLPQHWDVVPVKRQYEVRLGKMLQSSPSSPADELRPYLRAINIQPTGLEFEDVREMWFRPGEFKQLRLQNGDLVVSEGGDVGRSAIFRHHRVDVAIQNAINRVRPRKDASTTYLHYWLQAVKEAGYIEVLCNRSTIPHFTAEKLSELLMPLPPSGEQCRIAAFLDYETARIDELVRQQERLLSLLEARETARISELVTRGLNDGVRLKESGHQALGDIPANWEVVRLKHLLRAPLTYGANEAAVEVDPTLPRYIRITDIDGQGNLRDETFRSLPWDVAAPYLLEDEDLLLARSGATVGKSFLYRDRVGPACFAGYMIRARLDPNKLLPEYAEAYMKSRPYWDYIRESNIQATIQNVSAEKFGNCPVPVPPLEEQIAILGKLADESKSSGQLHVQASRSIDYLLERRSALISAAVTGQLDLSDWQPPAFEAVAEVA